jgi:hypothetical protein
MPGMEVHEIAEYQTAQTVAALNFILERLKGPTCSGNGPESLALLAYALPGLVSDVVYTDQFISYKLGFKP